MTKIIRWWYAGGIFIHLLGLFFPIFVTIVFVSMSTRIIIILSSSHPLILSSSPLPPRSSSYPLVLCPPTEPAFHAIGIFTSSGSATGRSALHSAGRCLPSASIGLSFVYFQCARARLGSGSCHYRLCGEKHPKIDLWCTVLLTHHTPTVSSNGHTNRTKYVNRYKDNGMVPPERLYGGKSRKI